MSQSGDKDMDKNDAVTDLGFIAAHVRPLADLTLAGPDLQDVDRDASAHVLHDLAVRLERRTGELRNAGRSPRTEEEAQP